MNTSSISAWQDPLERAREEQRLSSIKKNPSKTALEIPSPTEEAIKRIVRRALLNLPK